MKEYKKGLAAKVEQRNAELQKKLAEEGL
jgi:hypothetical protein